MKKQIIFSSLSKQLLMPAFLLFAGMFTMKAQNKPSAILNSAGVLQLPTNVALGDSYEFSIASFGFQNETQAINYFKAKSTNDYFFRPNFNNGKVSLYLKKAEHPGWTVSHWNNLLNSQTTSTPLLN